MTTRRRTRTVLRLLIALLISVIVLFPIYWLFIMAFKPTEEVFANPPVWWPSQISFGIFAQVHRDGDLHAVWSSLIIATSSTVIAMFLGTIAAYSLARFRTGGNHLANWIISQRMIPPITIVFPVFGLFVLLGWVDTYVGLIILYTAFNLPYVIWMMRGYIEDVPIELEESALVDGLTRWQALLKVVFPMARTGLFATAVFTFIFAWNEFAFAVVLTRTEVLTFPVLLTHYFGVQFTQWARVGAISLIGALPVFLTVALAQRFLVRGISMGAIKG